MAKISQEALVELRERTGVSLMECKKALVTAGGDLERALDILKERSVAVAAKKQGRALGAGVVAAYVHAGAQVGAMVLLSSETDFVAKNEVFIALAREIAMHAAAMRPQEVSELLKQPFIKDAGKTIEHLVSEAVQKFGERIEVSQVVIYSVK